MNNGLLKCPPIEYACARSTFDMLSPTNDSVPPPCESTCYFIYKYSNFVVVCDPSCASCSVAHNPVFCLTCPTGRRLNGNDTSTCLLNNNTCNGSTYLNSRGRCSGKNANCFLYTC